MNDKTVIRLYAVRIASVTWCITVLSIIIAANTGNLGWAYELAQLIPLFDKFGHAFLYGGMSFVAGLALPSMTEMPNSGVCAGTRFPLGSALILLFSVVEELSQLFLIHRSFDLVDLLVNVVTIIATGVLVRTYTST